MLRRRDDQFKTLGRATDLQNPPAAASIIPADDLGKTEKLGEQIFRHTPEFASKYVGDKLMWPRICRIRPAASRTST
ncbi:hypothetical protein [Burkholderia ambifaria]|uniref:hypothetical protein n=1 Tax=Burkholderia ambifaria TaxID=152480 RepID=UPI001588A0B4|nr:hypothetical protein [Burkholderia ambifaria]MBR8183306.1 hypothetical protein [Burkholderia ambifaria]